MPTKNKGIAIFCSDLHLSLKPPIFRSNEPDWFAAMQRPLDQIRELQDEHQCPIFCAGDIFDKWNSPPELINFAMKHLPSMYCIPGQHDLPEHDLNQIKRSAYWTLVASGHICNLSSYAVQDIDWRDDFLIHAFPYGTKITPYKDKKKVLQIALIHQYNWTDNHSYPDAPKDRKVLNRKEFQGYDLVFSGDNHIPFTVKNEENTFINCGALMVRKSDDWRAPSVWLLHEDGNVERIFLHVKKDIYLEVEPSVKQAEDLDIDELLEELNKLDEVKSDFREAVYRYLKKNGADEAVKKILIRALDA